MVHWLQGVIGIASAIIALLVYLHSKQRQRDSFLGKLTDAYESFWTDLEMREVRSWIANDSAFAEVKDVFSRRRAQDENPEALKLTREEYLQIDKLDKFCSLMMRMVALHVEFRHQRDIWASELWEYWLRACFIPVRRPDIAWYIRTYWGQLAAAGEVVCTSNESPPR